MHLRAFVSSLALVSANRNNAGLCGAFTVNLNNPLSNANTNIGARLSFLIEEIYQNQTQKSSPLGENSL
jgi:hypothetical protein